jgi:hypothetical protein
MCQLIYEERLKILGIEVLELRRLHFNLVNVYRILFSELEIESKLFSISLNSVTRGQFYKLLLSYCNDDVRK